MKKQEFYTVCKFGESTPCAIFQLEKDANLYGYVRFSSQSKVEKAKLDAKSTFGSLPFQEGIAFNRIMRLRSDLYNRGKRGRG